MKRYFILLLCLTAVIQQLQAQVAEIKPAYPQRGELVTIIYHPDAAGAVIGPEAQSIDIVFTYSTFYELPVRLPMKKQGNTWIASFILQRYATYATFYFQSGGKTDQPAPDKHYAIAVYKGDKRVKNGYLHEAYSLGVQVGKSASLPHLVQTTLEKELNNYPDNYEARLRLLTNKMNQSKDPAEKLKLRNEARQIIAAKLEENPTVMGNINLVTMGYLIIGENTRLDSVRQVILTRFPHSAVAKERVASLAAKERDTAKRTAILEDALRDEKNSTEDEFTDIHSKLFELYAASGKEKKALYHAAMTVRKNTPYTPATLKDIAGTLTKYRIAPDSALVYIQKALDVVEQYPAGIILFFPEFGYIPRYVADSTRALKVREEKSALLSLTALNKWYLKDRKAALNYADQAAGLSDNPEALRNAAIVYSAAGHPQRAFDATWRILLKNQKDTAALETAKINFLKFNPSADDFNRKLEQLKTLKRKQLKETLKKELMEKNGPELNGITDLAGKPLDKEMLKGKIVVIDFWATWCIPCMEELPYLQKVYNVYKSNPDVVFMVVNSGARNTIEDAKNWAKKNNRYTFPLYFNNDPDIGEKVGFTLIPTVAVLDKEGKMQFRTIGFEGAEMEDKLATEIDILLEK